MQTTLVTLVGDLHHVDTAHFLLMVFDTINCGILHYLQNWMYCVTMVLLLVPINPERQSYLSVAPMWDIAEYLFLL